MTPQSVINEPDIYQNDLEPLNLRVIFLASSAGSILALLGIFAAVRFCKFLRMRNRKNELQFEGGEGPGRSVAAAPAPKMRRNKLGMGRRRRKRASKGGGSEYSMSVSATSDVQSALAHAPAAFSDGGFSANADVAEERSKN